MTFAGNSDAGELEPRQQEDASLCPASSASKIQIVYRWIPFAVEETCYAGHWFAFQAGKQQPEQIRNLIGTLPAVAAAEAAARQVGQADASKRVFFSSLVRRN